MKLQFVFGNPGRASKKVSKKIKGGSKVAKKKKSGKKKKASAKKRGKLVVTKKGGATVRHSRGKKAPRLKITRIGKAANPKRRKKKSLRRKNPYAAVFHKRPALGSSSRPSFRKTTMTLRPGERTWLKGKVEEQQKLIGELDRQARSFAEATGLSPAAIKRLASTHKTKLKKFENMLKRADVTDAEKKNMEEQLKKLGYEYYAIVNKGDIAEGGTFGPARKGKRKKAAKKKKKGGKKAKSKKGKKKSAKKKKGSRRKKAKGSHATRSFKAHIRSIEAMKKSSKGNPKRRKKGRKTPSFKMKKGQSVRLLAGNPTRGFKIKRTNPGGIMDQFDKYTGHSVAEAGSLALGGALYGAVNSATAKYAKPVHNILAKVPVVGSSLPTLLVGAVLNYLGEQRGIKAASVLGKGLIGASIVGMGVNASRMVPGLNGLGGIDYTLEGADFGGFAQLPEGMGDEGDFGGIDYTMEGIDYTMSGYGDESDYGSDEADFGEIPEGMGEGQMG